MVFLFTFAAIFTTNVAFAQKEPLKIRIGWTVVPIEIQPLLWEKKDLMKNYGKTYTVQLIWFQGSSPQIQALAAKELDIAYLAYSSFAMAVVNANLDVKVVADCFQDGVPGYHSIVWAALEESPIKSVADLKDKKVSINVAGAGVDLALRTMLKKYNLVDKKNVFIVEAAFPNQEAVLRDKKIDAGVFVQPFYSKALIKGGLRPLFTSKDAMGQSQFLFGVARSEFLREHPKELVDFFQDYLVAWRWFIDPKNRDEALRITARYAKQDINIFKPWAFQKETDWYRDPDGLPNLEVLQNNVNLMKEMGFITRSFNVKEYDGLSYIKEAAARLKGK